MDISHLNKQQQLAVCSTEGKVRVIAGAGTGKTLVLVNRYAYIVNELGVDPNHVLCLTFTNKAAKEMRIRLADKYKRQLHGNITWLLFEISKGKLCRSWIIFPFFGYGQRRLHIFSQRHH